MQQLQAHRPQRHAVDHVVVAILAHNVVDVDAHCQCTLRLGKGNALEHQVVVGPGLDDAHCGGSHSHDGSKLVVGLGAHPVEHVELARCLGILAHGLATALEGHLVEV